MGERIFPPFPSLSRHFPAPPPQFPSFPSPLRPPHRIACDDMPLRKFNGLRLADEAAPPMKVKKP
jgi:hypothetical protein